MPAASPQAPKPQIIAASTSRTAPMFMGTLAAGLDFDTRADPSTIIAAQRSVNALPIITTTAEAVTPAERGIVYLRSRRLHTTRRLARASDSAARVSPGHMSPGGPIGCAPDKQAPL